MWHRRGSTISSYVVALLFCFVVTAAPTKRIHEDDGSARSVQAELDRVLHLPGWGSPSFRLYSGYVTVSEEHQRAFYYVFAEAQSANPLKAPVVLWLNGGPGCSSLGGGFLSELGPFYPRKNGKSLQANPFAWNQKANIIFLESPAFVGFSYSNTSSDIKTGDKQTAVDNHAFLKGFFQRHAVHAASPFWIAGESYGGHYLPQLAYEIVSDPTNSINFQGFMLGNPLTDPFIDSHGALQSWYTHGMISDDSFSGASNTCNFSSLQPLQAGNEQSTNRLSKVDEDACEKYIEQAEEELGAINIYDIYEDVCLPERATAPITQLAKLTAGKSTFAAWRVTAKQLSKSAARRTSQGSTVTTSAETADNYQSGHTTRQSVRRKLTHTLAEPSRSEYPQPQLVQHSQTPFDDGVDHSNNLIDRTSIWGRIWRKVWPQYQADGTTAAASELPESSESSESNDDIPAIDPCVDREVARYFNSPKVQAALHANTSGQVPGPWADCNDKIQYSIEDVMTSMMPLYPKLIAAGLKIVIYSGDVDGILPTLGTRTWVKALGLKVVSKWKPWTDSAGQPGGWAEVYEKKVAIVTVRNAGHMVPYTQARRAYDLFQCIVLDSPPSAGPLSVAQHLAAAADAGGSHK